MVVLWFVLILTDIAGKKSKDKDMDLQMHLATGTATIVRMLIKYQHIISTVSPAKEKELLDCLFTGPFDSC